MGHGSILAFLCALLCLFLSGEAFQWKHPLRDAKHRTACEGEEVAFSWKVRLADQERMIKYTYAKYPLIPPKTQGGKSNSPVMTVKRDPRLWFVTTTSRSGKSLYEMGIQNITKQDSMKYMLAITVGMTGTDDTKIYTNHYYLEVESCPKQPKMRYAAKLVRADLLMARVEAEPVKVASGPQAGWHVALSCGNFRDLKVTGVKVVWTTPSGKTVPSTSNENGDYKLVLDNPAEIGRYSCMVDHKSLGSKNVPQRFRITPVVIVSAVQEQVAILIGQNKDLKEAVQKLQTTVSRQVSFYVRTQSDTSASAGSVVKLTRVSTNQGNAYSTTTGKFRAPYKGTYYFSATAGFQNRMRPANLQLMQGSKELCRAVAFDSGNDEDSSTCSATVHLNKNQEVWLKAATKSYFKAATTTFTGFLISADE